jgi:hypothetical protein
LREADRRQRPGGDRVADNARAVSKAGARPCVAFGAHLTFFGGGIEPEAGEPRLILWAPPSVLLRPGLLKCEVAHIGTVGKAVAFPYPPFSTGVGPDLA